MSTIHVDYHKPLTRAKARLYKKDPWTAMSGNWPRLDCVGGCNHWNDGHYGLLCFQKQPTGLYRIEFLHEHLPGWIIHVDRIPGQIAYRTTNSNWNPA